MARKSIVVFVFLVLALGAIGTFHLLISPLSHTVQHLNEMVVQWSKKKDAIWQTAAFCHVEHEADFDQTISPTEPPFIAKVTMLYGQSNEVYERALKTHIQHAELHNYSIKILRQKMLGRLWTKPAYLLEIVLEELAKPPMERIEWLFWFDADTVIVNPEIPLEIFIPERADLDQLHFLCGHDHNGLNDGAFLLRVSDYAVHMLAAALSVETYRPQVNLKYSEQSAIEHVVLAGDVYRPSDGTRYIDGYAKIPQRWMNAYMGSRDDTGVQKKNKKRPQNGIKEGDLLLHFAGSGSKKKMRMQTFMDSLEANSSAWRMPVRASGLIDEVDKFWSEYVLPKKPERNETRSAR